MNKKEINWIWHGRRKMSVHHLDIFLDGLTNNGFGPVLDYVQKNQLNVMFSDGDTYLFNDEKELNELYNLILTQIQKENFAQKLYKKNNELFGNLLLLSGDISKSNLSLYDKRKITKIYDEFMLLMTQAPLIRVQLAGIDACWSKESSLKKELREYSENEKQYENWVQIISYFQGESVAKAEQMDFLLLVNEFYKDSEIKELLKKKEIEFVDKMLKKEAKFLGELLNRHMEKYEWVNSEYTGEKWNIQRWLEEIAQFLSVDLEVKIDEMKNDEQTKILKKEDLIKKLGLSEESLRIIEALDCFSTIRDWAKGYYVRALSDYKFLLEEIATRLKVDFDDLLYFSIDEVRNMFEKGEFNQKELGIRKKNGVIILMEKGEKKIYSEKNDIEKLRNIDAVKEMISKKERVAEFNGRTGFPGKVRGKVKVILNSEDINDVKEGDILVTYMTTMEFTPVFKKIAALITDEGGISSHAAIISREFKIPCIIGSRVATRVLESGDEVEVDADNGVVKIIS